MFSKISLRVPFHTPRFSVQLLALCSLLGAMAAGCSGSEGAEDAQTATPALAQTEQALNCHGSSCDDVLPNNSPCKADMRDTGLGPRSLNSFCGLDRSVLSPTASRLTRSGDSRIEAEIVRAEIVFRS
ncbi:MAG TPA: hypothetical protein VFQ61_02110 [Polyangiaceae bacterium]|nr:hypothetical protein [Polyangiaceae bacterium]